MNAIKFNELLLQDKAIILAEFGVHVESRQSNNHWIHLYSMGPFFIEAYYCMSTRQIDNIKKIEYSSIDMDNWLKGICMMWAIK